MDKAVIAALREERKHLKKKLEAVETTLAAYGAMTPAVSSEEAVGKKPSSRGPSEKTVKIRAQALEIISSRSGRPVPTQEILNVLENEGVDVGGKRPIATLSALLSNTPNFKSKGRSGWVLRENVEGSEAKASEPSHGGEVAASPNKDQGDPHGLLV